MIGNKRNFSLSIWDHEDNFLCNLKSVNMDFEGQSFNENLKEEINGEKTLSFSVPMYVFNINNSEKYEKTTEKQNFIQNEAWRHIYNEQKIRYTEYDNETQEKIRIEEFVLKQYTESRNGEEKIAECTCESLAVYELGKVGWGISFDIDYITPYEETNYSTDSDFLTIDYWLKKIFYKETNLGRVSNTTECTYLLQGIQLRDTEGYPIDRYSSPNEKGEQQLVRIQEPIATTTDLNKYYNSDGWYWEVQAKDVRNPASTETISTLYEEPIINMYTPIGHAYIGQSYQKYIGTDDSTKELRPHPIDEINYERLVYVTEVKRRLFNIERSNIYNIIQELCSIFSVWAYFEYHYDVNGRIDGRKILFKSEAINEDIEFDFSYGKNLLSCQRSSDSNELITKLIVPDTESSINEGMILSIKEATASPTGESYLYNFKYFFDNNMLSKGPTDENSDEYKINFHNAWIKKANESISILQKSLVPLYDRKNNLEGDLTVQEASRTAIIDNMQAIQDKIDPIPPEQRVINSWQNLSSVQDHVGPIKTISITTIDGNERYYLKFDREDVLYKDSISVKKLIINDDNEIIDSDISISTGNAYTPRVYIGNFIPSASTEPIPESTTTNFILLDENNTEYVDYIEYSEIDSQDERHKFIKGVYLKKLPQDKVTFVRVRFKYAPLIWYYLLLRDYWKKLKELEKYIDQLQTQLLEINNKILVKELGLNHLLNEKNKKILDFEKQYKPYIREGYWEASNYQGQIKPKFIESDTSRVISNNFNGYTTENIRLSELNLNESLNNYTKFIIIPTLAEEIDIDSIDIKSSHPENTLQGEMILPRYRGNDYEIYLIENEQYCIAVAPSLVDTYDLREYDEKFYGFYVSYTDKNGNIIHLNDGNIVPWSTITQNNNPLVINKVMYLTDDNIIPDSIKITGFYKNGESVELTIYEDYDYIFEHIGYKKNDGERVDLSEQKSYSSDILYDYITKINFKNTNLVNECKKFRIDYNEEITLDFLYQDAVQTSKKYGEPQISYDVNVIDISSLQGYKNYKPRLGQKVPIYDKEMGFNGFEGLITSVSKVLEKPQDTQITIATYTSRFEDIFQKLTATMTNIQYNENSLFNAANAFEDGSLKQSIFTKTLADNEFRVQLGTNNDISIDKQSGITLLDVENNNAVKLIGRGIFLTDNYNNSDPVHSGWKTGITGEGINANAIVSGNINTKNIQIWNASENQIQFVWNDQGLIAYGSKENSGTSTSTQQDFVDYNKYIKFNGNGLEFNDNEFSALKLGWDGLKIQAQKNSLNLDAQKGLVIQEWNNNSAIARLELGKLNDNLYGLRLKSKSGITTFQNDSDGDLWLHRYIRVGGNITNDNNVNNPTAGIYGLEKTENVPTEMQMGLRRNEEGKVFWDDTPIRFWAGPQDGEDYKNNLHITEPEFNSLTTSSKEKFNSLTTKESPSLAKFKVSANGDILASGIDVGGWIGGGTYLRSADSEAILRSGEYSTTSPVISVGQYSTSTDGSDYNFRLFKDGSINIGRGNFIATSSGVVTAKEININPDPNSTNSKLGNFIIRQNGLEFINDNYKTAMYAYAGAGATNLVFQAGLSTSPNFSVDGKGTVVAKDIKLTGNKDKSSEYLIDSDYFTVKQNGEVNIRGGASKITGGNIGGLTINSNNLVFTTTETISNTTYTYTVGLYSNSNSTGLALQIGTTIINTSTTTAPFRVYNDGRLYATNANITGVIKANSGKIGSWTLLPEWLYTSQKIGTKNYYTGMHTPTTSTDVAFYAGTIGHASSPSSSGYAGKNEFVVNYDGSLKSSKGIIGGWTIDANKLYGSYASGSNNYYTGMQAVNSNTTMVFFAGASDSTGTNAPFWVKADGSIIASKLTIQKANNNYYAGINNPSSSTGVVFYAGKYSTNADLNKNDFFVQNDGYLKAAKGEIGGWIIDSNSLYIDNKSYRTALYATTTNATSTIPMIYIGKENKQTSNDDNTKFKVSSDGSVFFHGGIYGWSNSLGRFRPGLDLANMYIPDISGNPILVEINQGLIVDIRPNV